MTYYSLGRLTAAFGFNALTERRSTYISLTLMSRFTSTLVPESAPAAGAMSDGLTVNALTVAGAALGAATVGGSLFVAATVAPAQTLSLAGAATLCAVAGQRVADGKPAIPGTGKKEAEPAAVAAAA